MLPIAHYVRDLEAIAASLRDYRALMRVMEDGDDPLEEGALEKLIATEREKLFAQLDAFDVTVGLRRP